MAVGAKEHEVLQVCVVELDMPPDDVVERGAAVGHEEAHRAGTTG